MILYLTNPQKWKKTSWFDFRKKRHFGIKQPTMKNDWFLRESILHLPFIFQYLQSDSDCSFLIVFLCINGQRNHKNTTWRRCFHKNARQNIEFQMWKMLNNHDGRTNNHEKKILVRQSEKRKTTCFVQ